MNVSWKKIVAFAFVAAITFAMILPGVHAQTAATGKFKLPFDAKLDKMALPSGDYTFSLDHGALNGTISIRRGQEAVGMVRAQEFRGSDNQSKGPVLVCIRHDGNVTLRALRLPNIGTFYFALPKDLKTLSAKEPQLIETTSVELNGY